MKILYNSAHLRNKRKTDSLRRTTSCFLTAFRRAEAAFALAKSCLLALCLIGQAFAVTLPATQVSHDRSDDTCTPPLAVKVFQLTDPDIWAYFAVNGAAQGDQPKIEWLNPAGQVASSTNFNRIQKAGDFCLDNALSTAADRFVPTAGKWSVRLIWNGTAVSTIEFNAVTPYEPRKIMMTRVLPNDAANPCAEPVPETKFLTSDTKAILWFYVLNVSTGMVATQEYYAPNGQKYVPSSVSFNPASSSVNRCYQDDGLFKISGAAPASQPGVWTVKVKMDGIQIFTTTFTISVPAGGTPPPVTPPANTFPMTLTQAGTAAGFKLTMFADGFPTIAGIGPIGIAFPENGGVLVSDYPGNIRRFPTRADGQRAPAARVNFGNFSGGGLAKSGGRIYAGDQNAGRLLLLNDDGGLDQVVVPSGFTHNAGVVTHPINGHIFLSIRDAGVPDRIVDFDPVAKTTKTFKDNVHADGVSFSADGSVLYAALTDTNRIIGYRASDGAQVFDSGVIAGADGCVVGGGVLAGLLFVNTNDGRVVQVDLKTSVQTVIATNGSRGDLVAVDPFDGSLLITQLDSILRLSPSTGSTFATQLITNGSFEKAGFVPCTLNSYCTMVAGSNSLPGWQIGGMGVDLHNNTEMKQPHGGALAVDLHLDGTVGQAGTLSQTFGTTAGQDYLLSFYLAGPDKSQDFPNPRQVSVSVAGIQRIFAVPSSSNLNIQWSLQQLVFTATNSNTTVTFSSPTNGLGYWGPLLDDVSVVPSTNTTAPSLSITGVGNGADFSNTVAPGSLATVFGTGLATAANAPSSLPFPTVLDGVSVTINGRAAPITFMNPTQINFQVPVGTAAGTATAIVKNGNTISNSVQFQVAANVPAVFQYGANRGIVQNQDYALNATAKPAAVNSAVIVYLTGIGATTPSVVDGAPAPSSPLAVPTGRATATIGGVNAPVLFIGLTPGSVGLAQANLQIPTLASGEYPLVITLNGQSSKPVLISIQSATTTGGGGPPPELSALPAGAKCVSGSVDYITFSLANRVSRQADEISIGGTKLCATCQLKPPIYGNFADKIEAARTEGLNVDACYDTYGTLNYLRMRP